MKNKLVKYFSTFFVLLLALLLVLWLSSPFWSRFALQNFLPENWKVTSLDMSLPGFSSLKIKRVQMSLPDGKKLTLNRIDIPYFYKSNSINVEQLFFTLPDDNLKEQQDNTLTQKPFKLPSITFVELPFFLNVKQAIVIRGKFTIQGELSLNPKAISFEGKSSWGNILEPVSFYISGIDAKTDLTLAVSVGKKQHFSLNYIWSKPNQPQRLHLSANVKTEFLQLLQNLHLIPSEGIAFSQSELALNADLFWPEYPRDIANLLRAKITGEMEIIFDKFSTKKIKVDANRVRVKFNNEQISLQTDHHLQISAVLQNKILLIKASNNDFILNIESQNNIILERFPVFNFQWQDQILTYKNNKFIFNSNNLSFAGNGVIKGKINPNNLVAHTNKVDFGQYEVNSKINFSYKQKALFFKASKLSLIQTSEASILHDSSLQPFEVSLKQFHLNNQDFQANLDLEQSNPLNTLLLQLDTSGNFNFKTSTNDLFTRYQCQYQLNVTKVDAQCEIKPNDLISKNNKSIQKYIETIRLKTSYQFRSTKLHLKLSATKLTSKLWAAAKIYPPIKDEQWTLNFNLISNILLNKLTLGFETIIPSLTDNSNFNLDVKSISAFNYQFSDLVFSLNKTKPARIKTKISLGSIQQKQGLTINDLQGKLSLTDTKQFSAKASFRLFSGLFNVNILQTNLLQPVKTLKLDVSKLNLETFFKFIDVKGLTASGHVDGSLPVTINNKGIRVKNGELHSTSTGILKYISPTDKTPFEQQNIAMQALQDFQYEKLTIAIEQLNLYFNQPGNYKFPMRIIGHNPKLLEGKSIALNPVLKGKLPKEAWHYFISKDIKQALTDKLKK